MSSMSTESLSVTTVPESLGKVARKIDSCRGILGGLPTSNADVRQQILNNLLEPWKEQCDHSLAGLHTLVTEAQTVKSRIAKEKRAQAEKFGQERTEHELRLAQERTDHENQLIKAESDQTAKLTRERDFIALEKEKLSIREKALAIGEERCAREARKAGKELEIRLTFRYQSTLQRESLVLSRETAASGREAAISTRDSASTEREAAITSRDSASAEREAAIMNRELITTGQEAIITTQATVITDREAAMADRELAITERDTAMRNHQSAMTKRATTMADWEVVMIDRETAVTAQESAITDRATAVTSREAAIIDRETTMRTWELRLETTVGQHMALVKASKEQHAINHEMIRDTLRDLAEKKALEAKFAPLLSMNADLMERMTEWTKENKGEYNRLMKAAQGVRLRADAYSNDMRRKADEYCANQASQMQVSRQEFHRVQGELMYSLSSSLDSYKAKMAEHKVLIREETALLERREEDLLARASLAEELSGKARDFATEEQPHPLQKRSLNLQSSLQKLPAAKRSKSALQKPFAPTFTADDEKRTLSSMKGLSQQSAHITHPPQSTEVKTILEIYNAIALPTDWTAEEDVWLRAALQRCKDDQDFRQQPYTLLDTMASGPPSRQLLTRNCLHEAMGKRQSKFSITEDGTTYACDRCHKEGNTCAYVEYVDGVHDPRGERDQKGTRVSNPVSEDQQTKFIGGKRWRMTVRAEFDTVQQADIAPQA